MKQEMYRPVDAIKIGGKEVPTVNQSSAFLPEAPFSKCLTDQTTLITLNGNPQSTGLPNIEKRLVQISPHHQRSFELRFENTDSIYWQDQFGNLYSTLNLKGGNLEDPHLVKTTLAPSGFLVYGLMDSDSMARVIRSSELMRQKGIGTEVVVNLIEPTELPVGGQILNLSDFKKKLISKVWEENSGPNIEHEKVTGTKATRLDIVDATEALDKMTFFIVNRAMPVSERLIDLANAENKDELRQILSRTFNYINYNEKIRKQQNQDHQTQFFDIQNDEDIQKYFSDYLPNELAGNVGKLHDLGLVHKFLNAANFLTNGGIVDNDSIRGERLGLGDNPITDDDITYDLLGIMGMLGDSTGIIQLYSSLESKGLIANDSLETFQSRFFRRYVKERGWEDNLAENIHHIGETFRIFYGIDNGENLSFYTGKLTNNKDLNYQPKLDTSNFAQLIFNDNRDLLRCNLDQLLEEQARMLINHDQDPSAVSKMLEHALEFAIRYEILIDITQDLDKNYRGVLKPLYSSQFNEEQRAHALGLLALNEFRKILSSMPEDQQLRFEVAKHDFLNKYQKRLDLGIYKHPQVVSLVNHISEEKSPGEYYVESGIGAIAFDKLPINEFFRALSQTDKSTLEVETFAKKFRPLAIFAGSELSRMKYLFTDGEIVMMNRTPQLINPGFVIENATYEAWIEKAYAEDNNPLNENYQADKRADEEAKPVYFLSTIQKPKLLQNKLKKAGISNVKINT